MAKKMGRPRKEIDQKQFEKLCALQSTIEEICGWFDISADTLEDWCKRTYGKGMTFSKVFAQKRGVGKVSLRRYQFQQAEHNATMAIWLGKQWLGQTDKTEQTVEIAEPVRIVRELDGGIFVDDGK